MPLLLALMPLLKTLFLWLLVAKGAAIIARIFIVLGIALFTNELIVQPILDMIQGNAAGIPQQLRQWLSAFGIDRVISIIATAYMLLMAKRVFLGRTGAAA